MVGHLLLDMPRSVALGIVETQMQLVAANILQLPSTPVS
jgi:hypothetical protein